MKRLLVIVGVVNLMDNRSIKEVIDYIEDHITEVFSLEDIGTLLNYSSFYCSTSFRKHTGTSIKNYTHKRRLQLAAEDLLQTKMRLIDIAFKYCYSSQEAFSRAFSKVYGLTPNEYRKIRLPILKFEGRSTTIKKQKDDHKGIKNNMISNLQATIGDNYPVNILHILNGSCMLDEFQANNHFIEQSTYISFNEAMCWGEVDSVIFSESFIEKRVQSLKTSHSEYIKRVIKPLKELFNQDFNTIVLWFGSDMFCQINMLTLLAYLDVNEFSGDVLFCMEDEQLDEMLEDAYEIDVTGYYNQYIDVLVKKEIPKCDMLPVMYQGIFSYLNYKSEKSEINKYINQNSTMEKKLLIKDLMVKFPQYGLGDYQFEMMIDGQKS